MGPVLLGVRLICLLAGVGSADLAGASDGYTPASIDTYRPDPDLGNHIGPLVAQDGLLYAAGADKGLIVVDVSAKTRQVLSRQKVVALSIVQSGVWAAELGSTKDAPATIARFDGTQRRDLPALPDDVGRVVALVAADDRPLVVTLTNLVFWTDEGWKSKRLSSSLKEALVYDTVAALTRNGRSLYIGSDEGEWGGTLYRIDPTDGAVQGLGFGNTSGIAADPNNVNCVLVADSLSHMIGEYGYVNRYCDGAKTIVFERKRPPTGEPPFPLSEGIRDIALASDSTSWIAGYDNLYRLTDGAGDAEQVAYDDPEKIGGLFVGRSIPGLLLIWGHDGLGSVRTSSVRLVPVAPP